MTQTWSPRRVAILGASGLTGAGLAHQLSLSDDYDEILLFGRESAGVPEDVAAAADSRVVIPMRESLRSINLAMTVAMALGEALRQVRG